MYTHYNHCHRATAYLQLHIIIIIIIIIITSCYGVPLDTEEVHRGIKACKCNAEIQGCA
jgi:hypothetical protein